MSSQRDGNSSRGAPSSNTGGTSSAPSLPAINRRSSTPLPGLSTTASSIRNRRSSNLAPQSSLRRAQAQSLDEEEDVDDGSVDLNQLEELRKGIIMPGMGGNRANTESHSDPTTPTTDRGGAPLLSDASAKLQQAAYRDLAKRQSVGPPPVSEANASTATSRGRVPATLKASLLKGRHPAATQSKPPAPSAPKNMAGAAKSAKGTPARATRYSLPVRAEKPVRTSKTSGKHVMLPSESQLAPLPDEEGEDEEDDDDDDDDDDDEDGSSEDESGTEEVPEAINEDASKDENPETARLKTKEEVKKRREEAQKNMEDRREEKAAQRVAKKPLGAPGYPSSARISGILGGSPAHDLPPLKGPAHARAPPKKPKSSGPAYHTFERLAPSSRVHTPLPRLTSYAISPSIHLPTLIGFLRREHGVRPRLYDECVYVVYFKPLLPGFGRAEVRSAPEPPGTSPGGESRREREIVEREESGYVGGYFAATNKEEEGDHIDDQGYIMGGEGEGEGGKSRGSERGDLTETETEREGRKRGDDGQASGVELSESEMEQQATSEAEYVLRTATREPHEDMETGMMTPKAMEPRRELGSFLDDEIEQLDAYRTASPPRIEEEGQLSNADVEGAMDLQHQQHLIESGEAEGMYPAPRRIDARFDVEDDDGANARRRASPDAGSGNGRQQHYSNLRDESRRRRDKRSRKQRKPTGPNTASHNHDTSTNMLTSRPILEALQVAELIILPYGVLVMYNLSAAEERSIISDVLSSGCVRGGLPYSPDDEETEAFHFCYDPTVPAPRIFNDFFTFRTSNHLLKLSLAHAIAQSTKLSVFEESMQRTLELTSHIPKELASSGELKLKRREALKLTGRLFKLRVDVNLTSNVLDTPELFWSEASLKALYDAIREYLEIDQRVENLNERLAVG